MNAMKLVTTPSNTTNTAAPYPLLPWIGTPFASDTTIDNERNSLSNTTHESFGSVSIHANNETAPVTADDSTATDGDRRRHKHLVEAKPRQHMALKNMRLLLFPRERRVRQMTSESSDRHLLRNQSSMLLQFSHGVHTQPYTTVQHHERHHTHTSTKRFSDAKVNIDEVVSRIAEASTCFGGRLTHKLVFVIENIELCASSRLRDKAAGEDQWS